ncbi:MAG: hypothetical protein Q9223_000753 [Gallowayella weberi]
MALPRRASKSPEAAEWNEPEVDHLTDRGSPDVLDAFDSDEDTDKDSIELELEKAVFGDESGFHKRLEQQGAAENGRVPSAAHNGTLRRAVEAEGEDDLQNIADADLFVIDAGPSTKSLQPTFAHIQETTADDAVWHDSDDDRILVSLQSNPRLRKLRESEDEDLVNGREYTKRLRRQFERLYPVPQWVIRSRMKENPKEHQIERRFESKKPNPASSGDDMSVDSDEFSTTPLATLLQQPKSLLSSEQKTAKGKRKLRPKVIDMQRAKDVGVAQPSAITSLDFHPHHPLLISSGPASTISLYHVAPSSVHPNPLLTALHVHSTPLHVSIFQPPNGSKILFAGRRRYFHAWDLSSGRISKVSRVYGHQNEQKSMERFKISPCGRWMGLVGSPRKGGGLINVLDAHTTQWVAEVQVESKGGIADFDWWGDGEGITAIGKGGEAVEWDGRQNRIVGRWVDEGAVGTTVLAIGGRGSGAKALGGDRWVAVGSSVGIVNIYDRRHWASGNVPANPKPTRAFDQLTTATSHLAFSPDGQLMLMASRWKRDALRLVYQNWPTSSTPLGIITAVAFAPFSEMLAVANEQGKITLWEIRA